MALKLQILAWAVVIVGILTWHGKDVWRAWWAAKNRVNAARKEHGFEPETRWWKM